MNVINHNSHQSMRSGEEMAAKLPKIAIIGAGFSGLCMGIKLKEAGLTSFTIYEKADKVGGTWREKGANTSAYDTQCGQT